MPAETATVPRLGVPVRSRETAPEESEIAKLAERQYGVVSRRQLLGLGFSRREIEARIDTHRLNPLHPGVYAVGHRVIPREGRWTAALLASGPRAALSHWSAAALWAIRPASRSIVHVTVPLKSRSWKWIRRHHSPLPRDETTVEEGIPVTTVPRTILDLAATEATDVVENLLRESEFLQLWDALSLPDLIERYPGKRGVQRVRVALERLEEEPEGRRRSKLEERFAPFLRRHRLPLPRFNDLISLGERRYRVDCHWPGTGQIVELDGWQGHRTRTAFREDRARDRRLKVAGYSVTRLTWNQLADEPGAVARTCGRCSGSRTARPG
jgi:very-short-patch-repair endonuclease